MCIQSYQAGRISLKQARGYAKVMLERWPGGVWDLFKAGIITLEEARPIALKFLENNPGWVDDFFKAGIITLEEAKPYALKHLKRNPTAFTPEFCELITKKYASPVLNQLDREGVDVDAMIDPELRHLLDSLK